jgi:hypothetical protein
VRQLIPAIALVAAVIGLGGCATAPQAQREPTPISQDDLAKLAVEGREKIVDCLRERGWDVNLEVDGWSMEGVSEQQSDAYSRDQGECQDLSGLNDISVPPLTDDRLKDIYAYEVELADCLRSEGYDIPEAPSEQAFMDRYTTEDAWFAYKFVEPTSEERWTALQTSCPQYGN